MLKKERLRAGCDSFGGRFRAPAVLTGAYRRERILPEHVFVKDAAVRVEQRLPELWGHSGGPVAAQSGDRHDSPTSRTV